MINNIINGGLALKIQSSHYFTNIGDCSGTYLVDEGNIPKKVADGLAWFMNFHGEYIYYSEERDNNYLYRLNVITNQEEVVLKKSCSNLILFNNYIYFIDEIDRRLYKCRSNGSELMKEVNEEVVCFTINNDSLFYATSNAIKQVYLINGNKETVVTDVEAIRLLVKEEQIILVDKNNNYYLTLYDLPSKNKHTFDGMMTTDFNVDERYIYCSNSNDGKTIYRISIEDGSSIRICGDKASNLHVIEDEIFFINEDKNNSWYKISVSGGHAKMVML
ncbi:DUF5050 domain-containing protein [Alkaliphilus transvaalensis]|uniref:DUF5050 domain-containing protein n=1 Tax=Alkaliphilus transvaalensis TaxID=114628 RepID=UPI0006867BE7|nr:DUF5050 domain-containing protein [Alkaliphilus transvaalensis]